MKRTSDAKRERLAQLVAGGDSVRAAARKVGVSHVTAGRILAAMPYSGNAVSGGGRVPPPNANADQPPPPPREIVYDPQYHGHAFQTFSAPLAFPGWSLSRIRAAIEAHDQGLFLESSTLSIVASRFGPVMAALSQAVAPALALPKSVLAGSRGLSRVLGEEVEAQLAPRAGLSPSPFFPPTLWGSCAIDLRLMGFSVLQHTYGDEDPETGVRPIYTRRWPTWAVQYYRYRRMFVAITAEGPIDVISGDGKFTLLADEEEPHFSGAIRALGTEVIDGVLAKQARASYVNRYGNPKWVGFMPPGVAVRSPEGDEFFNALRTIQGADGFGALPNGSDYRVVAMASQQSTVFKDALDNVWQYIAAILLGSDGTMTRGTGVYSAPIFAGVRRDLIDRMLKAKVRGINQGHVAPWLQFNYAASIAATSGWQQPVLEIPLPDPDSDARAKSYAERSKMLTDQVVGERAAGFIVDQARVEQIAASLDVEAPVLVDAKPKGAELYEWHSMLKLVSPDEIRSRLELPPLPEGVGSVEQLAKEREEGKDKAGGGSGLSSGFASEGGAKEGI